MDVYKGKTYKEDMARDRYDQNAKGRAKEVEERATAMVDGAGQWMDCKLTCTELPSLKADCCPVIDPGMDELFATITRPGRFKWEAEARNDDIAKAIDANVGKEGEATGEYGMDPFAMVDPGQETVSLLRLLDVVRHKLIK